jgi:hypothetical protein
MSGSVRIAALRVASQVCQELTFAKRPRPLPVGLTNEVEVLKARWRIADGCHPILSCPFGTTHNFPVPELSPWQRCPDHPDADNEDRAYRDDEANEAHWKAVPLVVSSTGFPIASGPALHGLIRAGHRNTEGSWWRAGGLIIGAERGSTWIEHRVLVRSPTTINVTLEHRHSRVARGRGWLHRLEGVGWRDVRMIRQATLLDHGPACCKIRHSLSLRSRACRIVPTCSTALPDWAAQDLKDIVVFPQGLDPNTFVPSCFMSTSHSFYAARMEDGHLQAVLSQ